MMACAATKSAPRSILGKFSIFGSDSFQSLRSECGFHNIDRRVGEMFLADATSVDEYGWEAWSLEGRHDIIEAATKNPEKHFGVKQLLAWEARSYHIAKPGIHRAVALGVCITNGEGGERYFLTINRKNRGLTTVSFTSQKVLPLLPDTYFLRTW